MQIGLTPEEKAVFDVLTTGEIDEQAAIIHIYNTSDVEIYEIVEDENEEYDEDGDVSDDVPDEVTEI
jgi:hypothetical protein